MAIINPEKHDINTQPKPVELTPDELAILEKYREDIKGRGEVKKDKKGRKRLIGGAAAVLATGGIAFGVGQLNSDGGEKAIAEHTTVEESATSTSETNAAEPSVSPTSLSTESGGSVEIPLESSGFLPESYNTMPIDEYLTQAAVPASEYSTPEAVAEAWWENSYMIYLNSGVGVRNTEAWDKVITVQNDLDRINQEFYSYYDTTVLDLMFSDSAPSSLVQNFGDERRTAIECMFEASKRGNYGDDRNTYHVISEASNISLVSGSIEEGTITVQVDVFVTDNGMQSIAQLPNGAKNAESYNYFISTFELNSDGLWQMTSNETYKESVFIEASSN